MLICSTGKVDISIHTKRFNKLNVVNSTFSGNSAASLHGLSSDLDNGAGGAIDNEGNLSAVNSTFFENRADNSGGGIFNSSGGGIFDNTGKLIPYYTSFLFCTFYGNQASSGGDIYIGIAQSGTAPITVTLTNSIVADNFATTGPNISGTLTTGGYNLIQNVTGATFLPSDLHTTYKEVKDFLALAINPQLSNNDKPGQTSTDGGHTQVLKLQPGSPAIDIVPLAMCHISFKNAFGKNITITTDQLNDPRPDKNEHTCDIGAYESSY